MSVNIEIDKQTVESAKIAAYKIEEKDVRKRAYALNIAANSAAEYLNGVDIETKTKLSLFKVPSFAKNFELADIYAGDIRLDVRITFDEKTFSVPKTQEKYDALPQAYIVVKLSQNLTTAEIIGFAPSSELEYEKTETEYYCFDLNILKPIDEIKEFIENCEIEAHPYSAECHEKIKELCAPFIDDEISESEKVYFIKHVIACNACRETFCDLNDFDTIVSQLKNYKELLNDSTLSVLTGNKKELEEAISGEANNIEKVFDESENSGIDLTIVPVIAPITAVPPIAPIAIPEADISSLFDIVDNSEAMEEKTVDEPFLVDDNELFLIEEVDEDEEILEEEPSKEEPENTEENSVEEITETEQETIEETFILECEDEELILTESFDEILEEESPEKQPEEINETDVEEIETEKEHAEEFSVSNENIDELTDLESLEPLEELHELQEDDFILNETTEETKEEETVEEPQKEEAPTEEEIIHDEFDLDTMESLELDDLEIFDTEIIDEITDEKIETEQEIAAEETIEEPEEEEKEIDSLDKFMKKMNNSVQKEELIEEETDTEPLEPVESYEIGNLEETESENLEEDETEETSQQEPVELNDEDEITESMEDVQQEQEETESQPEEEVSNEIQDLLDDDLLALLSDDEEEGETTSSDILDEEIEQSYDTAQNEKDADETIETLFDNDGKEENSEETMINIEDDAESKATANKAKRIIILASLLIVVAGAAGASWFINNQKASEPIGDNALETANSDGQMFDFQNKAGKEAPAGPAVSQDINKSMANSFSDKPAAITITKIAWQVSEKLASDPSVKEYLQTAGKNIQINLQNDLAYASDVAFNNSIKVSFEIGQDNTMKGIQILESSGSDKIDQSVETSIKNTLKYVKVPKLKDYTSDYFLTIVINF